MTPSIDSSLDRPQGGNFLDWLALAVSSEATAVAFVWWAVLLTLTPACLVCALGFHESGALDVAFAVGAFGVVLGLVATRQLVLVTGTYRDSATN